MTERLFANAKSTESEQKCSGSCKHKPSIDSSGSAVDRVMQLQRTAGNQAVQRLINSGTLQTKLTISQPGDTYEQKADKVSDQVMRMQNPVLQRQEIPEEVEEKEVQKKSLADSITPLVQRQADEEDEEKE